MLVGKTRVTVKRRWSRLFRKDETLMLPTVKSKALVIDVDGTLIEDDLNHIIFKMTTAHHPFILPKVLGLLAIARNRAKRVMVDLISERMDFAALSYNTKVIEMAKAHRATGGEAVLCSGSDQVLVQMLADHVGVFDDAFGSTMDINLVSANKAGFLRQKYPEGFAYIGNSSQDYKVWAVADEGYSVRAPEKAKTIRTRTGEPVQIIIPR